MVMDFGVAKAVTEASGRQQLTTAGSRWAPRLHGAGAGDGRSCTSMDDSTSTRSASWATRCSRADSLPRVEPAANPRRPRHPVSPATRPAACRTLACPRSRADEVPGQAAGGSISDSGRRSDGAGAARDPERRDDADLHPARSGGGNGDLARSPLARLGSRRCAGRGGALALTLVRRPEAALAVGKRIARCGGS